MDRYDAMASIPRHVERDVSKQFLRRREKAVLTRSPYCFICNQPFGSPEAVWQHCRDKHEGEGETP